MKSKKVLKPIIINSSRCRGPKFNIFRFLPFLAKIEENREKSLKSAFGDKAKFFKKFSDIAEKRWESVSDVIWTKSKFSKFWVLGVIGGIGVL